MENKMKPLSEKRIQGNTVLPVDPPIPEYVYKEKDLKEALKGSLEELEGLKEFLMEDLWHSIESKEITSEEELQEDFKIHFDLAINRIKQHHIGEELIE